jgi:hypothetical protein
MVPWWRRLIYGLVGWVIAICALGIAMSIWEFAYFPTKFPANHNFSVSGVFGFLLLVLVSAFAASIFGWLLGIPYVLLVRNSRGWRFWVYLVLGSGIGPALFLSPLLYSFRARSSLSGATDYVTVYVSALVSCLTALIYLLLLRRAQTGRKLNPSIKA